MAQAIDLAEVIQALRAELITAQQAGTEETIRFNLNNVEFEFQTVVEKQVEGEVGGKIKFLVLDADAKASGQYKHATLHKIKLSLEAVDLKQLDPTTAKPSTLQLSGEE